MSKEQDSMLFYWCWSWCVVGIVEIADVARTRFNVVLFDVGKKNVFQFWFELFVWIVCLNCLNFGLKCWFEFWSELFVFIVGWNFGFILVCTVGLNFMFELFVWIVCWIVVVNFGLKCWFEVLIWTVFEICVCWNCGDCWCHKNKIQCCSVWCW